MLIRFTVENVLSFRERVSLSFVPVAGEKHPEHVVLANQPRGFDLLKLAVVYGANASGKSNLVRAIATAQQIITHSAEAGAPRPIQPFRLDDSKKKPSRFEFEIRLGERNFAYGFVATAERIEEEWLYQIDIAGESCVFERKGKLSFPGLSVAGEERQYLEFTGKGTLANRLFLTECRERNVVANVPAAAVLGDVLSWFESRLTVLFPEMEYSGLAPLVSADTEFRSDLGQILRSIDTGIESVEMEDVPLDGATWMTKEQQGRILETLPNDRVIVVRPTLWERYLVFRGDQGTLRAQRMVFRHGKGGNGTTFDRAEESDGTRRFMDLVPALLLLQQQDRVFIIDEFDRSLHPQVAHCFLANFLKYSAGKESQLVVMTHETTLLEQDFLRRDEIWLVEKGRDQSSRLTSLAELEAPPEGSDLREDYLHGRFGGVPLIRDFHLDRRHATGT